MGVGAVYGVGEVYGVWEVVDCGDNCLRRNFNPSLQRRYR